MFLTYEFSFLCRFTNNILSTAQQVWLQKFGGAKNRMKEFTEVVKEEPLEIKKSVSELTLPGKEAKQEEKLTSDGLRPGERSAVISICCHPVLMLSLLLV